MATMNRSDATAVPSLVMISTGPSIRIGPPGTTRTRRRSDRPGEAAVGRPLSSFDAVGTDDHQILIALSRADQPMSFQIGGSGPHHRAERLLTPGDHCRLEPLRTQPVGRVL